MWMACVTASMAFLLRCGDADQEDVVAGQLQRHVVGQLHVLTSPQVLGLLRAVQSKFGQIQVEGMRGVAVAAGVEHGNGDGAA